MALQTSEIAIARANRFILPDTIRTQLMVHLLDCAPNEGVGLIGVQAPVETATGIEVVATSFIPGRNIEQSPLRYTMDPRDVAAALKQFRLDGHQLGAVAHSHLKGPATPSVTDVHEWNFRDVFMIIASFAVPPPMLQAWRVVEEDAILRVRQVPLIHTY